MSPRQYRAAIVGTGGIAHAHAQALADAGDRVRLEWAIDVDPQRAADFAATWSTPDHTVRASTDLAEVLAAASPSGTGGATAPGLDLDLVHVCTPPQSHAMLAAQVLRAGVDVLLEKPPTLSLAELDELVALEEETGAHVSVVFQHRFGSGAQRLRALLDDPAAPLGRPLVALCNTLWYRDAEYFAAPWRGRWETEGGGPTMGHGIHQLDLLLSVLGPWAEVTAMAGRQARDTDTEDVSMALVRFENGALASIVNSVVSPRQVSALRFDTEHATVELDHLYGYTDDDWTFTPAPGHDDLAARWVSDPDAALSSHGSQVLAILDALDAGDPPPVTSTDARRTMELVAALYASAFTGAPVRRGEIGAEHAFATAMQGTGAPWATTTVPTSQHLTEETS
ncbi:Gfo/Idh/MocA family oxidoreductase [Sanguibacter sp. 25GB23B1]|uniref:Gfo/Idh/MocA family protein n=1 Tax=unclassified Sanguibacter TaxID=2645534 RepID=UPI0032AF9640